tara:strand:- start:171 stop:608 length:438 start_codon:yes stop_codon:yes gene_type:complete
MDRIITFFFILSIFLNAEEKTNVPSKFWLDLSEKEKISFVNGAYGAMSLLKNHHKNEVRKQFLHDKNWIQPYYIERFYELSDEYLSEEAGYNIRIIVLHMDAFYSNSDNYKIPVLEAMRVVSLMQDGLRDKANLRLIQLQRKYNF